MINEFNHDQIRQPQDTWSDRQKQTFDIFSCLYGLGTETEKSEFIQKEAQRVLNTKGDNTTVTIADIDYVVCIKHTSDEKQDDKKETADDGFVIVSIGTSATTVVPVPGDYYTEVNGDNADEPAI